jgi:hypothetical protein
MLGSELEGLLPQALEILLVQLILGMSVLALEQSNLRLRLLLLRVELTPILGELRLLRLNQLVLALV